jgi:hypothetical protein
MKCSACGVDNTAGRKFCGECGAKLPQSCAACGTPYTVGEKFCGECGAGLVGSGQEALGSPPAPLPLTTNNLARGPRRYTWPK